MMKRNRILFIVLLVLCIAVPISLLASFSLFDQEGKPPGAEPADAEPGTEEDGNPADAAISHNDIPPIHRYAIGDTIHSIADSYGISAAGIARYNGLIDSRLLAVGTALYLPKGIEQRRNSTFPGEPTNRTGTLPTTLAVSAFNKNGNIPLRVDFYPVLDVPDDLSCVWDFGTGYFSREERPSYTYMKSGDYTVRLSVADGSGREVLSSPLTVRVKRTRIETKEGLPFYTIDHVNGNLDLGEVIQRKEAGAPAFDMETRIIQRPVLLKQTADDVFTAIAPGYAKITLTGRETSFGFYLFVSPFPSQHSVEPEYDWYKTQFDTGMYGNCGPACVAIALHWATGKYISVEKSREEIGLPIKSGALSYQHMIMNFNYHRIKTALTVIDQFNDMKRIIDWGNIAIVSFNTTVLSPVEGDERLVFVDRFYPDTTGHYIVIKGYSLDEQYFIAYDPIPSDWQGNSLRYTDGVSMIGRNRYFKVEEILRSIKGKNVLEIERERD
ncbi:MAG: C39 family peptidase [Spirochaetales bacterium]|nr:C39 family peptidase [Spirochaetales bacterium]